MLFQIFLEFFISNLFILVPQSFFSQWFFPKWSIRTSTVVFQTTDLNYYILWLLLFVYQLYWGFQPINSKLICLYLFLQSPVSSITTCFNHNIRYTCSKFTFSHLSPLGDYAKENLWGTHMLHRKICRKLKIPKWLV